MLLNRVRRIRGQIHASKGPWKATMAAPHCSRPSRPPVQAQLEAADELADVVKAYLK